MYVEKPSNPTNSSCSEPTGKLNNLERAIVNYLKLQRFERHTIPPIIDLISDVEIAAATQIKGGVSVVKMILEDLKKKGVVKRDRYGNWGLAERFLLLEQRNENPSGSSTKTKEKADLSAPVEIVPESLSDELTKEEEAEKLRLERKVERGLYEAASALKALRDLKLYRNSHSTFEEYCQSRFGFKRRHCYQLIDAAEVINNLIATNGDPSMCANGAQKIIPTAERQVRPLVGYSPTEQRAIWSEAVKQNKGKVPSGRIVKEVAQRMYPSVPSTKPEIAHHLKLQPRGLVEINTPHLVDLHQRYGRIYLVHKSTVEIWARNIDSMTMNLHKLKHSEVEPVPIEKEPKLLEVRSRLEKLFKLSLDPLDREILMLLERPAAFTPREMECLEAVEARYSK